MHYSVCVHEKAHSLIITTRSCGYQAVVTKVILFRESRNPTEALADGQQVVKCYEML